MNTCGTCRYRGEDITVMDEDSYEDKPTGYFLCERIKHINKDRFSDDYMKPGQGAGVKDGSGYYAALCVEADFGCNKWEPALATGHAAPNVGTLTKEK